MKCHFCGKETENFFGDGTPVCPDCAKKKGFDICTETGKYKDFACNYICSDCDKKG